jgi:hypothetical protein
MNFYDLNQIIEQSKLSEQADIRRAGFTPAGKTVAPAPKPAAPTAPKPAVTPTVPAVTPTVPGAKPAPSGAKPTAPGAKRPAKVKLGKIPPTCPSFGCKEPETSPQETAKNIQNLKPEEKQKVDDLVQDLTAK